MEYQGIKDYNTTQSTELQAPQSQEETRGVDDYRIMVETVIDTGEELLMVSPFAGNAFTANFWNVPSGEVGLDELPDNAALRIAREATGLLVELTDSALLGTRIVKTERNGHVVRRLVYTYCIAVRRDNQGNMLERFCLSRDYVGHIWLKHGKSEIHERRFDSLDTKVRDIIVRYQGA